MTGPVQTLATLNAIAEDLALCDLGLAVTRGKLRLRYVAHRKACLVAIDQLAPINPEIAALSDDALLAALTE